MRPTTSTLALTALLATLALVPATGLLAQPSVDEANLRYLLRVQEVVQYQNGPAVMDEAFIFRDGLAVVIRTSDQQATEIFRAQVAEERIEALKVALSDNLVGVQEGRCDVAGAPLFRPLGNLATKRATLVSWFGLQDRRVNHLQLGHQEPPLTENDFDLACSGEVNAIATAALEFLVDSFSRGGNAAPAGQDLLFEIRNRFQEDVRCGQGGFDDDYFIFRDGLMLRLAQNSARSYSFARVDMLADVRQELFDVLNESQVGLQGGECRTWFFQPFAVPGGCLEYTWQSGATWFGVGGRRQATIFSSELTTEACTVQQLAIQAQVTTVVRNSLAQTFVAEVNGRLPEP